MATRITTTNTNNINKINSNLKKNGCSIVVVIVTCEGNLFDPLFKVKKFPLILGELSVLVGDVVFKIHKLEPWNSVRVTLSIPREAALRLRQLANEGSSQLRALGILSVQVDGDHAISLRIANANNTETQEIVLRTAQDGPSTSGTNIGGLSRLLSGGNIIHQSPSTTCNSNSKSGANINSNSEASEKVQFKSPNVVCPPDSVVPKVPQQINNNGCANISNNNNNNNATPSNATIQTTIVSAATAMSPVTTNKFNRPFPFTSMNQAIHSNNRDNFPTPISNNNIPPPPPYPGNSKNNNSVNISSPLLVNLLQNDGLQQQQQQHKKMESAVKTTAQLMTRTNFQTTSVQQQTNGPVNKLVTNRTINTFVHQKTRLEPEITLNKKFPLQANHLNNNNNNNNNINSTPSALINTSIRQNKLNSTITNVRINTSPPAQKILPPPPPYSVAVNRNWDTITQSQSLSSLSPFLDLTPSLTDLKPDDLDDLLPTLERDLARSPLEIPEELTTQQETQHNKNFLINPLTGELEPQLSDNESDNNNEMLDVFTGLQSPVNNLSDDTTNDDNVEMGMVIQSTDSDNEGKYNTEKIRKTTIANNKIRSNNDRDSPNNLKPTTEKIKLRLKLEKSEPINAAYKVDVSFVQQQQQQQQQQQPQKKATSSLNEELRVPPLHISLRGRNHAFITNKKKKLKQNKEISQHQTTDNKLKKSVEISAINDDSSDLDNRKVKKLKLNEGEVDVTTTAAVVKQQKERRGSDSELIKANVKFVDSNGVLSVEKKRRLSQTDSVQETEIPTILGSTNIGTISSLPQQKSRKDKTKLKDGFKSLTTTTTTTTTTNKDLLKKNYNNKIMKQQVTLPTGEIDMEAKFKQRLLEGSEKALTKLLPRRTDNLVNESCLTDKIDSVVKTESEPPPPATKEKSPEPDKSNIPDKKVEDELDPQKQEQQITQPPPPQQQSSSSTSSTTTVAATTTELVEKQSSTASRSPNSGAQGEDSGIESMDALSEKSPNQASQSPHADIIIQEPINNNNNNNNNSNINNNKSKTQVPDMLDIEAQLAKMEGINGIDDDVDDDVDEEDDEDDDIVVGSDLKTLPTTTTTKLEQCYELTTALQDSLKQGAVSLSSVNTNNSNTVNKEQQAEVSLVPIKSKAEEAAEPLPVRVTPPLFTYSNPEKGRNSDSPNLSEDENEDADDDNDKEEEKNSNSKTTSGTTMTRLNKSKSLLEQLLIEIPENQTTTTNNSSSQSPATRSVRTRALSKLNSPELNSPIIGKQTRTITTGKRKRLESDITTTTTTATTNNFDDSRNKKPRKCSENAAELIKACMGVEQTKLNNINKKTIKINEESSDSDEPLIEKVRKTNNTIQSKTKLKTVNNKNLTISTRRSVRTHHQQTTSAATIPTPNTRSKETEAVRRKTRSAVLEGENKRKKEVK